MIWVWLYKGHMKQNLEEQPKTKVLKPIASKIKYQTVPIWKQKGINECSKLTEKEYKKNMMGTDNYSLGIMQMTEV